MVFLAYPSTRTAWLLPQIKTTDGAPPHPHLTTSRRDSLPLSAPPSILTAPLPPSPPSSPSLTTRISPAVLFIIVILAVIFFISGLLHLLVRFLIRKSPGSASSPQSGGRHAASRDAAGPDALQRQLQQLFHLHDSGLDQAFIDALPVFLYREIVGPKEPFDCAVCLCEFATDDHLRLLPACGHAFHLQCIDTWLLSNSTCPLCRDALFVPGLAIENPIYDFDEPREEEGFSSDREDGLSSLPGRKPEEAENIVEGKRVFPVRLGKFRRLSNGDDGDNGDAGNGAAAITITTEKGEQGETSSSNLDARRCFSMGCCQYVVGDADLRVALPHGSMRFGDSKGGRGRGLNGNLIANGVEEGRRLSVGSKGESFSVSKIWLWSNKKGKFPVSSDASSLDGNLPWLRRSVGDA